jgi:hypothetical protein
MHQKQMKHYQVLKGIIVIAVIGYCLSLWQTVKDLQQDDDKLMSQQDSIEGPRCFEWKKQTSCSGRGVNIGIMEVGSSKKDTFNTNHPALSHVNNAHITNYNIKAMADKNTNTDSGHGTPILGILASKYDNHPGIIPNATIYCGVADTDRELVHGIVDIVDNKNANIVNMSFSAKGKTDGLNIVSLLADYLTYKKSVLFVTSAGNYRATSARPPGDAYNVLTVGSTNESQTKCCRSRGSGSRIETRSFVDILAPGENVNAAKHVYRKGDELFTKANGDSCATVQVTGVLGLIWEKIDRDSLSPLLHVPLVQRAIVINSANKNIRNSNGLEWCMTEAASSSNIPLDNELGAGVFDFKKTLESFQALRNKPNMPAQRKGWDYNKITGDQSKKYNLDTLLLPDSLFCVTLTFERQLVVQREIDADNLSFHIFGEDIYDEDLDKDNIIDGPDIFTQQIVPNIDIHVYCQGDTKPIAISNSRIDTVEHLYFRIPKKGYYSIEVKCISDEGLIEIPYVLAWRI